MPIIEPNPDPTLDETPDPNTDLNTDPNTDPNTDLNTDPNTDLNTDPNTDLNPDPNIDPVTNPDTGPSTDPGDDYFNNEFDQDKGAVDSFDGSPDLDQEALRNDDVMNTRNVFYAFMNIFQSLCSLQK